MDPKYYDEDIGALSRSRNSAAAVLTRSCVLARRRGLDRDVQVREEGLSDVPPQGNNRCEDASLTLAIAARADPEHSEGGPVRARG